MARFQRLIVVAAAITVLGITMLGKDSGLAVAQEEPAQMQAARQQAVRNLGMMYNDDNVDAQVTTPEEFLAARLRPMANTQIDVVTFDPCDVDNITIYPSKIAQFTEFYPLAVAGHDPAAHGQFRGHCPDIPARWQRLYTLNTSIYPANRAATPIQVSN